MIQWSDDIDDNNENFQATHAPLVDLPQLVEERRRPLVFFHDGVKVSTTCPTDWTHISRVATNDHTHALYPCLYVT